MYTKIGRFGKVKKKVKRNKFINFKVHRIITADCLLHHRTNNKCISCQLKVF